MRFIKNGELDTSSLSSFFSSLVLLIVFSPVQFVITLGKRIVFLSKVTLSRILFLTVVISAVFTIVFAVIRLIKNQFSFTKGVMPLIVMIIACIVCALLYLWFDSANLLVYKSELDMEQFIANQGSATVGDAANEVADVAAMSAEDDFNQLTELSLSDLVDVPEIVEEEFLPKPNDEILQNEDIIDFQNRLKSAVAKFDGNNQIEEASFEGLKSALENTESCKIGNKLVEVFAQQIELNDELTEDEDISNIPSDFTLCF